MKKPYNHCYDLKSHLDGTGMSMPEIKLNADNNHLSEIIAYLKLLAEHAEAKNNHIDRLRQMNFSLTLFVFAGLAGFGVSQTSPVVMVCDNCTCCLHDNSVGLRP